MGPGGSVLAPALAERLGVPLLDRAIPVTVAERLATPLAQALAAEDPAPGIRSLLARFGKLAGFAGTNPSLAGRGGPDEGDFNLKTEQLLWEVAETSGGVVLGRAGAIVLADVRHALHARLDGPAEARLTKAIERQGIGRAEAARAMRDTDRARLAYVDHFYHRDARDPSLYHLVLDSTALPLETCAELIAIAAVPRLRSARP